MTSITWSNDVDPIKTTIFWIPKSMAITAVFVRGDEKSRARSPEAQKMHFCTPRRVFAHAHYKLKTERLSGHSDDIRTQKFSNSVHI